MASVAERPNFDRYPPEDFHRPEPRLASLTRSPMAGRTPTRLAVLQDEVQLGILFHHWDDLAAHFLGQHGHLDVLIVFEAVADDGGVVIRQRHHRHQLGLGAGFQAEMERLAEFQNLFHHLPLLVDLDGVHATVAALILVLGDGGVECAVQLAQPVFQDIGEADEDGEADPAQHQRIDQFLEVDRPGGVLFRVNPDVPAVAYREVALAPARDIIEVAGHLRCPPLRRLHHQRAFAPVSFQCGHLLKPQCPSNWRNEQETLWGRMVSCGGLPTRPRL